MPPAPAPRPLRRPERARAVRALLRRLRSARPARARHELPATGSRWRRRTERAHGSPVDAGELDRLKRWRSDRADGKPAYTVATNATLEELLRRRPTGPEELLAIRGIGPSFVERHGEDIIGLLAGLGAAA